MIRIVDSEIAAVELVPPGTTPNYAKDNPLWRLVEMVEGLGLVADREHYVADRIQYLFPVASMALYGPAGDQWQVRDPRDQDNKNDFQKQNIQDFRLNGIEIARGYVHAGTWTGTFLHVAYTPRDDSPLLSKSGQFPGPSITLSLRVGSRPAELLEVPYDPASHRYILELWSDPGQPLKPILGPRGQAAIDKKALLVRPSLVQGDLEAFQGPAFDRARDEAKMRGQGLAMVDYQPDHLCHPTRPLRLEMAFASADRQVWDSQGGANYRYEFAMSFRGWNNYLMVGQSDSPHGGVGSLEYRNLYSNYFGHEARRQELFGPGWLPELGRDLASWNIDADGRKPPGVARERFMAVDYMDLHVLKPGCAIGIHRHRDNQEVFLMLAGKALMVTGDWAEHDGRDRAFEARTMKPGDLALIKGGEMHALLNALDENVQLFMFGGYD
jgi:mannose-6-phosphate isomerase-like protein (cupin superfamily)